VADEQFRHEVRRPGGNREKDAHEQDEISRLHAVTVQQDGAMTASPSLVVKCTSGAESPERTSQAFTVASTALAAGASVSMWLTGESVWFAVPGRAEEFELPHSAPLGDLRDAVLAGGTLTVCTQCAARRDLTEAQLLPGVRIAGAASFVDEVLRDGTQALVY
jgi:predicted peroxiredoxin